jgi:hypothetical protein
MKFTMNTQDIFERNRVILCHFDTYSTALVFARYGATVLAPSPLPEGAGLATQPVAATDHHDPASVLDALGSGHGLDVTGLKISEDFDVWMTSDDGPIRIHLARFMTTDAPRNVLEPLGGIFKSISEMRGLPMLELNLMRQVFNLIMGS